LGRGALLRLLLGGGLRRGALLRLLLGGGLGGRTLLGLLLGGRTLLGLLLGGGLGRGTLLRLLLGRSLGCGALLGLLLGGGLRTGALLGLLLGRGALPIRGTRLRYLPHRTLVLRLRNLLRRRRERARCRCLRHCRWWSMRRRWPILRRLCRWRFRGLSGRCRCGSELRKVRRPWGMTWRG
jgi:hypothetical protein